MLHRVMGQHCYYQATAAADRERAVEALGSQARDAITQAGQLTARAAVSYARRSRGRRQRPGHGWNSLTPTERDVAQLVAEGLSNPGIADRLFISRATVKTHLTHVFTKLDITNRAQLSALVTRGNRRKHPWSRLSQESRPPGRVLASVVMIMVFHGANDGYPGTALMDVNIHNGLICARERTPAKPGEFTPIRR